MSLEAMISVASERPLEKEEVEAFCAQSHMTVEAFLDSLSHEIAVGYSEGKRGFTFCDSVMNNLYSLMIHTYEKLPSEYAWSVFLAFDEGEYHHSSDPATSSPEELYTKPMIQAILKDNEKV